MKYQLAYDALVEVVMEFGEDRTGFGTKSLYWDSYFYLLENPQYKSLMGHIFKILFPRTIIGFSPPSNGIYAKLSSDSPNFFGESMLLSEIRLSAVMLSPTTMTSTRGVMIRFTND